MRPTVPSIHTSAMRRRNAFARILAGGSWGDGVGGGQIAPQIRDNGGGRIKTAVQINGAKNRFHCVGQDMLNPAAGHMAVTHACVQPQLARDMRQRVGRYQHRVTPGQFPFCFRWEHPVQHCCHRQAQHPVPNEFQAFVILGGVCATLRQCQIQQRRVRKCVIQF